ncbi:hypothetical protein HMPREF9974_11779 [Staphylococcus epidermidis NIH05005]|nr:hypothetical protein HMPREF9974_11779 [Staphylococcus epidermidis NIH05005]
MRTLQTLLTLIHSISQIIWTIRVQFREKTRFKSQWIPGLKSPEMIFYLMVFS